VAGIPETRFAKIGDDRIAYQVFGEGPLDLVVMMGRSYAIDCLWEYAPLAEFLTRLASFSRVIVFDPRGSGASDALPIDGLASWEYWADDVTTVLDAVGSERVAWLASADTGALAILFAATRPERTRALALVNTSARYLVADDYPFGITEEEAEAILALAADVWGTEAMAAYWDPGFVSDHEYLRWQAKSQRAVWSPRAATTYVRWAMWTDVRPALPSIGVPTLVVHYKDAVLVPFAQGRYLGEHIPRASFVQLDGINMSIYGDAVALDEIERFLKGFVSPSDSDRALAVLLFTDIVNSTETAVALGDSGWRSVLDSHDVIARTVVQQYRGRLVKLTGDGVLATFDGPGRAIRCAFAMKDALQPLGLEIRAGVHAGEIELRGDDIAGIAVHIAERVQSLAPAGEVFVSETVPRLVAGSGIDFADNGEHELKGVPGTWRLHSAKI
jgi:class 3 adenylate cyclase/pimeloyl-ACP methyl ester carboxylesterase